jgi:hypothetical protein
VLLGVSSTIILMTYPDLGRGAPTALLVLDLALSVAAFLIAVAMGLLWVVLLGLALAGSYRPVPLLDRLAQRQRLVRLSFAGNCLGLFLATAGAALACHAGSITRTNHDGGRVYLLYDEDIPVPRWAYALGMYRVSLQAREQWGPECVVLDRLNADNLRSALAHGHVVILASHGTGGDVAAADLVVSPPPLDAKSQRGAASFVLFRFGAHASRPCEHEEVPVSSQVQLVYLAGCDSGLKAAQWQEHLAPAKAITFDRLSSPVEHLWWLLTAAPSEVRALNSSPAKRQ